MNSILKTLAFVLVEELAKSAIREYFKPEAPEPTPASRSNQYRSPLDPEPYKPIDWTRYA